MTRHKSECLLIQWAAETAAVLLPGEANTGLSGAPAYRHRQPKPQPRCEHKTDIYYGFYCRKHPTRAPPPVGAPRAAERPAPMGRPPLYPAHEHTQPAEIRRGWRRSGSYSLPQRAAPVPSLGPAPELSPPLARAAELGRAGHGRRKTQAGGGEDGRREGRREPRMLRAAPPRRRAAQQMGLRAGGCGDERGKEGGEEKKAAAPPHNGRPPSPLPRLLLPSPPAWAAASPREAACGPPYLQSHLLGSPVRAQPAQELQGALAIAGPLPLADRDVQLGHLRRARRDVDVIGHDSGQDAARHGDTRAGRARWRSLRSGAGKWRGNFHLGSR